MAKKNKWDDYIQFDDWKKDDEFNEDKEEKDTVEQTEPREIQGLGISKEEEVFDLSGMIAGLNAQNKEYVESAKEDEIENERALEEQERQAEAEEKAAKAQAIFEKEQAEREARLFAEQEAEARKIAEELEKKQNNIFNKAGKAFEKVIGKGSGSKKDGKNVPNQENLEVLVEEKFDKQDESVSNDVFAQEKNEDVSSAEFIIDDEESNNENEEAFVSDIDIVSESASIGEGKVISVQREKKKTPPKKEKLVEQKKKETHKKNSAEENDQIIQTENSDSLVMREDGKSEENKSEASLSNNDFSVVPSSENSGEENNRNQEEVSPKFDNEMKQKDSSQKGEKKEEKKSEGKKQKAVLPFWKKKDVSSSSTKRDGEKEKEPDWKYVATHDEMTGLWNRTAYEQAKKENRDYPYAVIYIDANNLKYANDTIGHEAGDALLEGVALQISEMFPEEGYRIGGDEFVVITEDITFKKAEDILSKKRNEFHKKMDKMTKETKVKGLVMSASFGYSFTDGSKEFSVVAKEAEQMMYTEKAAYKKANPKYDMRRRPVEEKPKEKNDTLKPTDPEHYDEMLTKEQRALKGSIKNNHVQVSSKSTQDIIREIQSRATEIIAILIASPTFDHLFIIQTADSFIEIVKESDYMVDYSYLYIIYQDCPVYKGSDEYLEEVTTIFNDIGKGLKTGKIKSEKDLLKIKGINIFKNIYVDA